MELDLAAEKTSLEQRLAEARQGAQAAAARVLLLQGALAEVSALIQRAEKPEAPE